MEIRTERIGSLWQSWGFPRTNPCGVRIYLPPVAAESSISPFLRMDFHSRTRATLRTFNPELPGRIHLDVSV